MTYIITETCVGVKDASCVAVCPVDCIYAEDDDVMMFINPDECIDCGACIPECPVNAIFAEDDTPEDQQDPWVPVNYEYFQVGREETISKFAAQIAAAKEKNRDSEHANPALYS